MSEEKYKPSSPIQKKRRKSKANVPHSYEVGVRRLMFVFSQVEGGESREDGEKTEQHFVIRVLCVSDLFI